MSARPPLPPRLELRGLCRSFGALVVADRVDLALPAGSRTALIGPNGAGKTTLVNLVAGALAPSAGRVLLDGRDVTALPEDARVRAGIARTFQVSRLLPGLTVADHVRLALVQRSGARGRLVAKVSAVPGLEAETAAILAALGLGERADRPVRALAYGERRLVELALAVALRPRVLLLDEPAAGVPAPERELILAAVAGLPADLAVLLVEHDMDLVFRFAARVVVLVAGAVLTAGTPAEVAADPRVRAVYLGPRPGGGRDAGSAACLPPRRP